MQAKPGNIAVIGSTGSIGRSTLDVVRRNPGMFRVVALAADTSIELLREQIEEFRPQVVRVRDEHIGRELEGLAHQPQLVFGEEGLLSVATLPEVHTLVVAVVGFVGLGVVLAGIQSGKHLALANKESLVSGGELVRAALRSSKSKIVPVDSEHNSIFQCLLARHPQDRIRRVILTASGGPFLDVPESELSNISPTRAIKHPRWKMGPKISVDSATLMNKGLEVIEAAHLFELPAEQIEVLIHPQSAVHGLIEFNDGSLIASMYEPDMRVPISFALNHLMTENPLVHSGPRSAQSGAAFFDFTKRQELSFSPVDYGRFPSLKLAYYALQLGKTAPAALNAANEVAVEEFLKGSIPFVDITRVVYEVVNRHSPVPADSLNAVIAADVWARNEANRIISTGQLSELQLRPQPENEAERKSVTQNSPQLLS